MIIVNTFINKNRTWLDLTCPFCSSGFTSDLKSIDTTLETYIESDKEILSTMIIDFLQNHLHCNNENKFKDNV